MPPEQPGIGRLTSTPQGVDMADGGSKPPQPMAPDTADDGMKPSRLGAPPHPLRPGGHLPQIPRSSAEFGGGGISLRDAYPSPFTLRVLRGYFAGTSRVRCRDRGRRGEGRGFGASRRRNSRWRHDAASARARGGGLAGEVAVMDTSGDLSSLILGFHHFRVSMAQQGMRRQGWIV